MNTNSIYFSDDRQFGNLGSAGYRFPQNLPVGGLGYLSSLGLRSYHRSSTTLQEAANNGSASYNTQTGTTTTFTATTFRLAASAQGNTHGNVHVCECIVLPIQTVTADRQKMEGYLMWKWGLAGNLPSDHPYKNSAPTNLTQSRRRRDLGGFGL